MQGYDLSRPSRRARFAQYHFGWYKNGMRSTIDKAGRVVVPKAMREELGLTGGTEIEIGLVDGRIEIEPVSSHVRLERKRGRLVAASDREMPVLTSDDVRALLEKLRR